MAHQVLGLGIGMGARDDVEQRIGGARLFGDLPGLEGVRDGEEQEARFRQIGSLHGCRLHPVQRDHIDRLAAQRIDDFPTVLDHHEGDARALQPFTDHAPDPAVPDDDRVVLQHRLPDRRVLVVRLAARLGDCAVAAVEPGGEPVEQHEEDRAREDREHGARQHQIASGLGEQGERHAQIDEDEGELADLREARRNGERRPDRVAEGADDEEGRDRFADGDDEEGGEDRPGIGQQDARIEQHPHRHEEQHGEGVAQGQGLLGRAMAELGLAENHAGEEGAEREGDAEELRGAEGDAERDREHGKTEKLARPAMGDVMEDPGDHATTDHEHQRDESPDLGERDADRDEDRPHAERFAAGGRLAAAREPGQRRQQHQRQHHREVFDDEPSDGNAPARGLDQTAFLKRAKQHHRAGDGEGEAEHDAGRERPSHQGGKTRAE